MVWMAVLYCAVGSVITHYIGRPQIALNFKQQRYEADFRHHLVRVREYSESIALDRGEPVERQQLGGRFGDVLGNYLTLINAQKRLIWFTVGFGQAAVVFPFIVAAPRFFSGAIQLGELMQISSAFGRVQDSLSWFVDNYSSLAAWRATTDRLTSFEESFQALEASEHIAAPLPNSRRRAGHRRPATRLARRRGAAGGARPAGGARRHGAAQRARRAAASPPCSARWPASGPGRSAACAHRRASPTR